MSSFQPAPEVPEGPEVVVTPEQLSRAELLLKSKDLPKEQEQIVMIYYFTKLCLGRQLPYSMIEWDDLMDLIEVLLWLPSSKV